MAALVGCHEVMPLDQLWGNGANGSGAWPRESSLTSLWIRFDGSAPTLRGGTSQAFQQHHPVAKVFDFPQGPIAKFLGHPEGGVVAKFDHRDGPSAKGLRVKPVMRGPNRLGAKAMPSVLRW